MEKITISKEIKQEEIISLEIEDTRNCYLKGNDNLNGITNYLGIWTDKQGIKVVKIMNQITIAIECYKNKSVYTTTDIERFMKNNIRVKVISESEFRTELDRLINILQKQINHSLVKEVK